MMVAIFECIDRMFAIVRPRKLLYMAIDGVVSDAIRANQFKSFHKFFCKHLRHRGLK